MEGNSTGATSMHLLNKIWLITVRKGLLNLWQTNETPTVKEDSLSEMVPRYHVFCARNPMCKLM
jgi:hypothetical protein